MTNYMQYTFECQKCGNDFTKKVKLFDKKARHQAVKAFHECSKCVRKSNKESTLSNSVLDYELKKYGLL